MTIDSNAGHDAGYPGSESYYKEGWQLCQIAGIDNAIAESIKNQEFAAPALSKLTALTITLSDEGKIKVEASYDSGYVRDVSDLAQISGYDPDAAGEQTIRASYSENGITKETTLVIGTAEKPQRTDGAPTSARTDALIYGTIGLLALSAALMGARRKNICR